MSANADLISGREFYLRLIRKLSHRGVLPALIKLQRLSDSEQDSMGALLERRAAETPTQVGLRFEDEVYTWAEINEWSNRCAHALKAVGVGKGDVVAIFLTNRSTYIPVAMGALKLGAIGALINIGLQGDVLANSLRKAAPKALVVGEELLPSLQTIPETELPAECFLAEEAGSTPLPAGFRSLTAATESAASTSLPETAAVSFGDPAFYVYTSGTTGMPKCAINKHRRLFMGGLFAGKALREIGPDDVIYCPLPMYHVTALMGGWFACLFTGATFALARGFSASNFWNDIRKHNATGFNYVGEMARYLWNQPPSPDDRNHRVTNMMGAGLRHEIWDDFKARFGIDAVYEVYGGSESPAGFVNLFNFDRTCGWSPRGMKVAAWDHERNDIVRGTDGRGIALKPGGRGVLLQQISAHQQFDGYTDPEATQSKILRDVFKPGDRWFNSGDLVLNQGHGHIQFVDRLGDTFRWHAENVATTEVEGVINGFAGILEAIVYGVEVPAMEGRAGMARLVVEEPATFDLAGLARHMRAGLPEFAVPRFLRLTNSQTDVTGTFRYKKADLKDEGFRPPGGDRVVLVAPGSDPQDLTDDVEARIRSGEIRL
ncbi:long-chain-acyl-CoA synthetase [Sporichthya polymorpha]|uniref:long-chain-acyl-CoA synthetase n=1 Tax=Sporichthya polymorpha TaxID=35751 RepID=UPI000491AADE|nr:long-chain-acyl-CoA synthetase [Sporichthya polymorpha]